MDGEFVLNEDEVKAAIKAYVMAQVPEAAIVSEITFDEESKTWSAGITFINRSL